MFKDDFPLAEYQERQKRVRTKMEAAGLDLLLVIHPVNINYLIGARHKAYQEFQCLFFTRDPGPLTMMTRLADVFELERESLAGEVRGWGGREPGDPIVLFESIMKEKGYLRLKCGLEVPRYYIHPYEYERIRAMLGTRLVADATNFIEQLKLVKSPNEIAYIRRAAGIADAAMETMVRTTKEGMTELEVAAEMHRTLMAEGSDAPPSPMNLAFGERTAYGHGLPSERRLRRGDYIMIEYGAAYKRYCSTIGRQLALGPPTNRMKEIYQVVRDACDACIAEMKDGVPAVKPHEAAKRVIAKAGMDQYRTHTTGYGIAPGFPPSWGESIHMMGDGDYALQAGMVLSVEPPVFIPEEGLGARIIDNVLVTKTGGEVLSRFTRDLIQL